MLGARSVSSELIAALEPRIMNDDKKRSYSVSWRLRRTTEEEVYVNVPVTGDLMIEQSDGTGRLDVDKMVRRAVEMGEQAGVKWMPEAQRIEPHPVQKAPDHIQVGGPNNALDSDAKKISN